MNVFEIVLLSTLYLFAYIFFSFIGAIIRWTKANCFTKDIKDFTKQSYRILYDNREVYDLISRVENLSNSEDIIWQKKK